jgi:phage shock protein PspC (stress-responsive transcriptional regulator)
MSTPPTPPDQPDQPDQPDRPLEPETGPTEPMRSGDPLEGGPERPQQEPPPAAAAAPPPGAGPRRLTRSSSDRVLGGVSGGLGRYFDIDPIIFRIGFVVLALAGGAGLLAYAAAWLLVPRDPVPGTAPTGGNRALTYIGAGILVIAACVMLGEGLFSAGPPLFGLVLLALLGAALWRAAEDRGGDGNRTVRRAILGVVLLCVAAVGFVAVALGAAVGGGAVIAGLVIAVGVALAASAFTGGARWLVLPALILAIPLGFAAAAGIDADGGMGERDYRPTTLGELRDGYELGVGELRLDLRGVDLPAGRTPLKLDMGIGSVRVLVPDDVCVASDVRVGAGYARILDRDSAGIDVDWRMSPPDEAAAKRLVIAGEVGVGELQVAHDAGEFDDHRRHDRPGPRFGDFDEPIDLDGADDNAACRVAA